MSAKTIPFTTPRALAPNADAWVKEQSPTPSPQAIPENAPQERTKRLTVDVPEPLHRRIKLDSFNRGLLMADVVRQLLTEKYPDPSTN